MAWISKIVTVDGTGKIQPTQVIARVKVFRTEGDATVVQIDTHGSDEREMPGKQSQTIQFGKESAQQLHRLLADTYGF